jgi:hypothetical protein
VKFVSKFLKLSALAAALAASLASAPAMADSQLVTSGNASARLDFTIVIPRVLSFRVGNATSGTVDLITFSPTAAVLGNATPVAGTGGDLTNGVVTASVTGNNGQITITPSTVGALNDGGTNTIAWTQITTAASVLTSATPLPAPTLVNGAGTAVNAAAPTNKVTVQDAKWTFAYANTTVPPSGTYGGVNVNNGRVTYTAAMP